MLFLSGRLLCYLRQALPQELGLKDSSRLTASEPLGYPVPSPHPVLYAKDSNSGPGALRQGLLYDPAQCLGAFLLYRFDSNFPGCLPLR